MIMPVLTPIIPVTLMDREIAETILAETITLHHLHHIATDLPMVTEEELQAATPAVEEAMTMMMMVEVDETETMMTAYLEATEQIQLPEEKHRNSV